MPSPSSVARARLRRRLGVVRAQGGYLPLLTGFRHSPRLVGYVGWAGRRNVGDDALLLAHRALLAPLRLTPLPNLGPTLAFDLVRRLRGGRPLDAVCLGGGTLVGNGHFRRTLETVRAVQPGVPQFVLGVGVESEELRVGNRRDVVAELERWVPLLADVAPVRVRGPRSAETLAHLGVDAEIVGDPALLLGDEDPGATTEPGLLGLNVGVADDQWGEVGCLIDVVGALGRRQLDRGGRVRIVVASPDDRALSQELAAHVGGGVELIEHSSSPAAFLEALRPCEVVVAEKLHAVVLASAVHVPAVALEYRPKCRDFQESIGRGRYVVRTDRLDLDELAGLVDEVAEDRDRQVLAQHAAVAELRARLRSAGAEILRRWPPTSVS